MPGSPVGQAINYRYVITVDRNDQSDARVETQGHVRRDDAQLAFAVRILDARKKFAMPNDALLRIDTRSDRRMGILHAVKVGPETITLRRRNASDIYISPSTANTIKTDTKTKIIASTITVAFWGSILLYGTLKYGYKSALGFLLWMIGFVTVICAAASLIGLAARGISALRNRMMTTERGRYVEHVVRRGLFYSYVMLITPVLVFIGIFGVVAMFAQFIDIWTTPLQFLITIVFGIRALGQWIGIW